VTTNNDTPQMFGGGARRDAVLDPECHDGADESALAGGEARDGLSGAAETDEAEGPAAAEPDTQPGRNASPSFHLQVPARFRSRIAPSLLP